MKHLLLLSLLIVSLVPAKSEIFDPKEMPSRFWFNTAGKKGINANYMMFELENVQQSPFEYNFSSLRIGYALTLQFPYEAMDKKDFFMDSYITFTYYPNVSTTVNGEAAKFKSYSWDFVRGIDIFGWDFIDISPLYGWGFGNNKIFIDSDTKTKISNPFFNLSLGTDFKLTIPFQDKGVSLGAFALYKWDLTNPSWKDKDDFGAVPRQLKNTGLLTGVYIQWTYKRHQPNKML